MKRVYVVEDSAIISGILMNVLRAEQDIHAVCFGTGEEMLDQLEGIDSPDLLLLDYYLDSGNRGAMNGVQIFTELRKQNFVFPIVLLTGVNDREKISDALKLGFIDVVHKESDDILTQVVEVVRKYLPE